MITIQDLQFKMSAVHSVSALSKEEKETVEQVAILIGFRLPSCSCSDKWIALKNEINLFIKNHLQSGLPHYKWTDFTRDYIIVNKEFYTRFNFTDSTVEMYDGADKDKLFALNKMLVSAPVSETNPPTEPAVKTATKAKNTVKSVKSVKSTTTTKTKPASK